MKLIYAAPSPYARKIRIVIFEKNLQGSIDLIVHNPFEDPESVHAVNPIGKVPVLILDDGQVLFDSPVIAEYIDQLSPQVPLFSTSNKSARWKSLAQQALADGILDAAFNIACEYRRVESERSKIWIERWVNVISRGLDALEAQIDTFPDYLGIAHIATACIPDYVELRVGQHLNWRDGHPKLAAWFDEFSQRPSMKATHPLVQQK